MSEEEANLNSERGFDGSKRVECFYDGGVSLEGVRFRIAELENGDDKALRSLECNALSIIVQGGS